MRRSINPELSAAYSQMPPQRRYLELERIYELIPRLPRAITFIKQPNFFEQQVAEAGRPSQRAESGIRDMALARLSSLLPFSFFEVSGQDCLIAEYDMLFTMGLKPRTSSRPITPNSYGRHTTLGEVHGWSGHDAPALFDRVKSPALELEAFQRAQGMQLFKLSFENILDKARRDGTMDKISEGFDKLGEILGELKQTLGVDPEEERRTRELNEEHERALRAQRDIYHQKEAQYAEMVRGWRRDLVARGDLKI